MFNAVGGNRLGGHAVYPGTFDRSCSLSGSEYRLGGWPRTVVGRLVGRVVPVGCHGLAPPWWLPWGVAGSAVPVRRGGLGRSGGSSPGGDPLVAAGHAVPSPC